MGFVATFITMEVPAFIFECLQEEIKKVQVEVLKKVADKYGINLEDMVEEFVSGVSLNREEKVYICRKQRARTLPDEDKRCLARVWNRGKGGQCTRMKCDGEDFCVQHVAYQKHGVISAPPPKDVFGKSIRALYK